MTQIGPFKLEVIKGTKGREPTLVIRDDSDPTMPFELVIAHSEAEHLAKAIEKFWYVNRPPLIGKNCRSCGTSGHCECPELV